MSSEVKSDSKIPEWMLGAGFDTDMGGDYQASDNLRFFLKKGESRKIIFLTEGNRAPVIYEHALYLSNRYSHITCLGPIQRGKCPICEIADEKNDPRLKRYKGMFFTIIDTNEFVDRSGSVRKDTKRLMCCKKRTVEILERRYLSRLEEGKGLKFSMFEAFRTNDPTSAAVGNDFTFIKTVDPASLSDIEEFDYAELFKPDPEKAEIYAKRLLASFDESEPWYKEDEGAEPSDVPY